MRARLAGARGRRRRGVDELRGHGGDADKRMPWCGALCLWRCPSEVHTQVLAAQVEAGALETPDLGPTPARMVELLEQWLLMKGQSKIRPSTLKTYRYLAVPVRAGLGEVPLLAVTSRTVEQYCRTRLRQGIRPASVGDERALIRMAMGWATAQGWWRGDAKGLAGDVELAATGDRRWLEADQVLPFLDAFDDPNMQLGV